MFVGRSRSTTPASLISGKSSTADQGVQVSGAYKRDDKKMVQPIQPPGQRGQPQRDRRDSRGETSQVIIYLLRFSLINTFINKILFV